MSRLSGGRYRQRHLRAARPRRIGGVPLVKRDSLPEIGAVQRRRFFEKFIGYRLSQTILDLTDDLEDLKEFEKKIRGKGMKGAVGTAASYKELLKESGIDTLGFEKGIMDELGIKAFEASTQTYSRKQDLKMMAILSSIASSLHKFSLDFRILQSPPIGEFSEPFGKNQVGSSAMPFKRNPINSEKINSLARIVKSCYDPAWLNSSLTILERSLDDSADRRIFIPEAFIALDEMLSTEIKVVRGMNVHSFSTDRLMSTYGIFSATERLLMELGKRGADRQKMHETIRKESLIAWNEVQEGRENLLKKHLSEDEEILSYMSKEEIEAILDASSYIGEAERMTGNVISRYKNSK